MKHPFYKSVLVLGAALALVNCGSDEATTSIPAVDNNQSQTSTTTSTATSPVISGTTAADLIVSEPCWVLTLDQAYIITTSLEVFTADGNQVGTYDPTNQTISDMNGTVAMEGVNFQELPMVLPAGSTQVTDPEEGGGVITNPTTETSSASVATSSASTGSQTQPSTTSSASTSDNQQSQAASSTSTTQQGANGVTVSGNLTQTVAAGGQTTTISFSGLSSKDDVSRDWKAYFLTESFNNGTYTLSASTVPEYLAGQTVTETFTIKGTAYKFVINVTSASGSNTQQQAQSSSSATQQQQQQSSSSVAKSSSSVAKSSSSQASTTSATSTISSSYTIKYVSGGASGSGWATRYWDCCKPSCSWTTNTSNLAKQCDVSGNTISDANSTSICNGGSAATCTSQIPMIVNDTLAYAFAAAPVNSACGRCFDLVFDGNGKYENKYPQQQMKGKHLIVMASNIGSDVSSGQFDVMIPGGGVGLYNGCANFGWGSQGAQYGGLLSDCESSVGYTKTGAALMNARVSCLTEKCNSVFANDATAKEGCLFLATWMHAAGNPTHNYKEVECPSELKAKY